MLTLTGTLRQFGEVTLGKDAPKPYLKLWVEHETPRDNGPADLRIEELLIPIEDAPPEPERERLLKRGQPVSVIVRAWAKLGTLNLSAVRIAGTSAPGVPAAK
jgi:hypothetical protein